MKILHTQMLRGKVLSKLQTYRHIEILKFQLCIFTHKLGENQKQKLTSLAIEELFSFPAQTFYLI